MTSFFSKLKLLLWRALIIRRRHKIQLLFELLLPITCVFLLSFVQNNIQVSRDNVLTVEFHKETAIRIKPRVNLLYSPYNREIDRFIQNVKKNVVAQFTRKFNTADELAAFCYENKLNHSALTMGIIFEDFPEDYVPSELKYTLRTEMVGLTNTPFPERLPWDIAIHRQYINSLFYAMQIAVDKAFIELKAGPVTQKFTAQLKEVPYLPHVTVDEGKSLLIFGLKFGLIFVLINNVYYNIYHIIEEKNSGIKELMKIMGMSGWMIWVGWFICMFIVQIFVIIFMVLLFKIEILRNNAILPKTDAPLLFLFMVLYFFLIDLYIFVISSIFYSSLWGASFGTLMWIVGISLTNDIDLLSPSALYYFTLLPTISLGVGLKEIIEYEFSGGHAFSNTWTIRNPYTHIPSLRIVLIIMIIQCVLLLLLVWYFDNVFPGQYGTARKWNFPFMKSYWIPKKSQEEQFDVLYDDRPEIEAVSPGLDPGIQIRKLNKTYGNSSAVNDLSIDIYTKQITVLLGFNGAGKTTTINLITGMSQYTSGTIIVDGYNIETNLNKVRSSLGLCPQHNLQFNDLTVLEHLMFFAMLKGKIRDQARKDSIKFLEDLNMMEISNAFVTNLNDGMRRKLSLGMASVGGTNVLMLDEPTSGLDPQGRREIWNYLLAMRREKTILITTHQMDEADILGDRIAIMQNGSLVCYGTSFFLKNYYEMGYSLSILTKPTWNQNSLISEIKTFVPLASIRQVTTGAVSVLLPTNKTAVLTRLFLYLDSNKEKLAIHNFSVSITSLEDVFLLVGQLTNKGRRKTMKVDNLKKTPEYFESEFGNVKSNPNKVMCFTQTSALIIKRLCYNKHRWLWVVCCTVMVFVWHILLLLNTFYQLDDTDFELTLKNYPNSEVFWRSSDSLVDLGNTYSKVVTNLGGIAVNTNDLDSSILAVAKSDEQKYLKKIVAGADFLDNTKGSMIIGYFGAFATHGPGVSINLISNALLKHFTRDNKNSITTKNKPINVKIEGWIMLNYCHWATTIPLGYFILMLFFLPFFQDETISGLKHLQIMNGVPRYKYLLVQIFMDLLFFTIAGSLSMLLIRQMAAPPLTTNNALGCFGCLIFLFVLAIMPFNYMFTYFRDKTTSFITITSINCMLNIFGVIITSLEVHYHDKYSNLLRGLSYCFSILPAFTFTEGIYRYCVQAFLIDAWNSMNSDQQSIFCQKTPHPCCSINSPECKNFHFYLEGHYSMKLTFIILGIQIVFYWLLLLLIDTGYPKYWLDIIFYRVISKAHYTTIDADVAAERSHVAEQMDEWNEKKQPTDDILLVNNLEKYYRKLHAVRGLSFSVGKQECFGLLGINGAGKTTTFKMLTGQIFPSKGDAKIMEFYLRKHKSKFIKTIGYCPQMNALNMFLTTREMLTFFTRIRGIKSGKLRSYVDYWINRFDLNQYENVAIHNLSGGIKRKLSTAIALCGDPPLILLDEPTSGIDPIAKRQLWSILTDLRKKGQSIVLTSHSMAECETICDRLGIMIDGQMKCIGNVQYLKNKFGKGFTIMVKLRSFPTFGDHESTESIITLKKMIEKQYECDLSDEHIGMVIYHITTPDISIGDLFAFMETIKRKQKIVDDYTVSDTSLEHVFLSFAKKRDKPSLQYSKYDLTIEM